MAALVQGTATDFLRRVEAVHNACRFDRHMVPTVYNGTVYATNIDTMPAPRDDIGVSDFVQGMEALGVRFWIMKDMDDGDRLLQPKGYHMLPAHWIPRAEALRAAFPVERNAEAVTFMRQRGDLAVGEAPEPDPMLDAVNAHRTWLTACAAMDFDNGQAEAAWIEANPDHGGDRLNDVPPLPTTEVGAFAAIRLVMDDKDRVEPYHAAILRQALAFLEGRIV